MSEVVKGCKMPAPARIPVGVQPNSPGRRLTSLKGGNRGGHARGYGSQRCYGDLSAEVLVELGEVLRRHGARVRCGRGLLRTDSGWSMAACCG
jgi:hypothetical protein